MIATEKASEGVAMAAIEAGLDRAGGGPRGFPFGGFGRAGGGRLGRRA